MGLEELFGRIEKRFGKEAVVGNDIKVDTVSSGSMALDEILGGGLKNTRNIWWIFQWQKLCGIASKCIRTENAWESGGVCRYGTST